MTEANPDAVSAGIVVIGDEILSGRTRDINVQQIAEFLAPLGIGLKEVRIVSDDQDAIVEAVKMLSARCTYVFTTGGIGPTHDDITADAVAAAFGRSIDVRDDAREILEHWYAKTKTEITPARLRMARIPDGRCAGGEPCDGRAGLSDRECLCAGRRAEDRPRHA
jgi:molybdenum cofactor synthesis domain-containing protein